MAYSIEDFLFCEIKRIEIDKWFEGIRINSDPGNDYVLYWVDISASSFRSNWESSKCKDCSKKYDCGWKNKQECDNFTSNDKRDTHAV